MISATSMAKPKRYSIGKTAPDTYLIQLFDESGKLEDIQEWSHDWAGNPCHRKTTYKRVRRVLQVWGVKPPDGGLPWSLLDRLFNPELLTFTALNYDENGSYLSISSDGHKPVRKS